MFAVSVLLGRKKTKRKRNLHGHGFCHEIARHDMFAKLALETGSVRYQTSTKSSRAAGVVASNQTNKAIRETQATVTTAAAGLLAPLNNLHLAL
jgi:hypothetical protein